MRDRLIALMGAAGLALVGCGDSIDPGPTGPDGVARSHTPGSDGPSFVWEDDIGSGLGQSDDDCDLMSLGFAFEFYGVSFSEIYVNSNGNATFGACNTDYSSPFIPDDDKIIVGPLYGDFDPGDAGDVYFNVVGTEGQRRAIMTWHIVPEYSGNPDPTTFQAILYEGTNEIVFGYAEMGTDGVNWTGVPMSVGLSKGNADSFVAADASGAPPVGAAETQTSDYVLSVSGTNIPGLEGLNICYVPDGSGNYSEVINPSFVMIDGVPHCSGGDPDGAGTDDTELDDRFEYDDENGFPIGSPSDDSPPPSSDGGTTD